MGKGERQRLWDLLFHEALERGADAFSIQPDTTYASSGQPVGAEPLMLYLRSIPLRWRWESSTAGLASRRRVPSVAPGAWESERFSGRGK